MGEVINKLVKYSIVIPAYNSAGLLSATVQSALAQDVDDIEVIVVDDGSCDNTFEVAKSFSEVVAIRQENAGDAAARNTGLNKATGEFVLFLDHDDLLHSDAVSTHYAAFLANPDIDMVFGSNLKISEVGEILGENKQPVYRFSGKNVAMGVRPSFSQTMYRKSTLDQVGGLRPAARSSGDADLNMRLLGPREAGLCHGKLVMSYRKHQNQQTTSPTTMFLNHANVLLKNLGPGGVLEDSALLARALKFWKKHYGQYMPGEIARLLQRGQYRAAVRGLGVFFYAMPHSGVGASGYLTKRFFRLT